MPAASDIAGMYARYIKPLSTDDRLRLLAVIARDLTLERAAAQKPARSLLELEGLGADLWQGIDAQAYVNELRDEWDRRQWAP